MIIVRSERASRFNDVSITTGAGRYLYEFKIKANVIDIHNLGGFYVFELLF